MKQRIALMHRFDLEANKIYIHKNACGDWIMRCTQRKCDEEVFSRSYQSFEEARGMSMYHMASCHGWR